MTKKRLHKCSWGGPDVFSQLYERETPRVSTQFSLESSKIAMKQSSENYIDVQSCFKGSDLSQKVSQIHVPHQKTDTKRCSELLVAFEPRNWLRVIPWTVCKGLARPRHGFRRVSSSDTSKTSAKCPDE
jgi:hypothetical protein